MLLTASALNTRCVPIGLLGIGASRETDLPVLWDCSTCTACGARGNCFCVTENGRWLCVFCKQWNPLESNKMREFSFSAYQTTVAVDTLLRRRAHHAIIVLDENLPYDELISLRDAMNESLNELPDDLYVGLITFGSSVRMYELGSMGNRLSCEAFSGSSPSNEDIREIAKHESVTSHCEGFITPLHICRGTVFKILNFLAESQLRQSKILGEVPGQPPRCLGAALEYALALMKVCDPSSGSILVQTSGQSNSGPGIWREFPEVLSSEARELVQRDRNASIDYYNKLSNLTRAIHTSVDIFCTGTASTFGIPALLGLTPNVFLRSMACSRTISIALRGDSSRFIRTTIRISQPKRLVPVHISGAISRSNEQVYPLYFETRSSPTVFFEDHSDSSTPDIYVQCITRGEMEDHEIVLTERLSKARPFLVMNGEAIAVLIAKRACVILASNDDIVMARKHVENEVYNLSRRVIEETIDQVEFDKLAQLLFHFYRGHLLGGPGSQYTTDDMECARSRFVNLCDFADAVLMMAPSLVGFRWGRISRSVTNIIPNESFKEESTDSLQPKAMPLSTLSLQTDHCLVLDQLTDVIVWFGSDVPRDASERSAALSYAHSIARAKHRYPTARVIVAEENSPMARWLRCRLSPEHKDPTVSSDENRHLISRLWSIPTDDLTYSAFLKKAIEGGDVTQH